MHLTAYEHGRLFFELYWRPEFTEVVELGSQNVNGSLRDHCPAGARYVGMDMAPGNGVDLVVTPGRHSRSQMTAWTWQSPARPSSMTPASGKLSWT